MVWAEDWINFKRFICLCEFRIFVSVVSGFCCVSSAVKMINCKCCNSIDYFYSIVFIYAHNQVSCNFTRQCEGECFWCIEIFIVPWDSIVYDGIACVYCLLFGFFDFVIFICYFDFMFSISQIVDEYYLTEIHSLNIDKLTVYGQCVISSIINCVNVDAIIFSAEFRICSDDCLIVDVYNNVGYVEFS